MSKYLMRFYVFILFFTILSCLTVHAQEAWPSLELARNDRVLILAPHPDDEVLSSSGIIQEAVSKDLPVRIVFFTYGDNNEWAFAVYQRHLVFMPKAVRNMGLMRHDEAIAAARVFGVPPDDLVFLGYPDFGTMNIWCTHWGSALPFKSMLTKVNAVPYSNALRPGASYKGEEVLKDLKTELLEFRPTKIFVSHPGDHNGDHRSLYLFTTVALWDLEKEIRPQIYPYIVHLINWPKPGGYHPAEPLVPPAIFAGQIPWNSRNLSREEIDKKEDAVKAHKSQYESSAEYLLSFVKNNELFGDFPPVMITPKTSDPDDAGETLNMPEDLTETERAAFAGVEERRLKIEDDNVVFAIKFLKPLARGVNISAYFFGYRNDTQFQKMPKIRVEVGAFRHMVYDQNRKLSSRSVKVVRRQKEIVLYVPLEVIGYPQRMLISATSRMAEMPLDLTSWRVLYITGKSNN